MKNNDGISKSPLLSVVMSVYNAEEYIIECVNSILNQSFDDFEFLIVDDASDDNTKALLDSINDSRLIVFHNDNKLGLPKNLNFLLDKATGKYIARMDGDDVSALDRFEKEVSILESDDSIEMVCSYCQKIGSENEIVKTPLDYEILRATLLFKNPITNSTVMFRNSPSHYYDYDFLKSQDYEMWDRMSGKFEKVAVINQVLGYYRIHEKQITKEKISEQEKLNEIILLRALNRMGVRLTDKDTQIYMEAIRTKKISCSENALLFYKILNRIIQANKKCKLYRKDALKVAMDEYYLCILKYCLMNLSINNLKLIILSGFSSIGYITRIIKANEYI